MKVSTRITLHEMPTVLSRSHSCPDLCYCLLMADPARQSPERLRKFGCLCVLGELHTDQRSRTGDHIVEAPLECNCHWSGHVRIVFIIRAEGFYYTALQP